MKWITSITIAVCLSAAALAHPPVPRPAATFQISEPSGRVLKLSEYRGKVVIVQFLYTTCPHCQAMAQMLTGLQKELGPNGLRVVGVAFNDGVEANPGLVDQFVKATNAGFPVGSASRDSVLSYLGISVMERFVVPQVLIIDRRGTVRAQSDPLGSPELQEPSSLRSIVDGLLKESATAKR